MKVSFSHLLLFKLNFKSTSRYASVMFLKIFPSPKVSQNYSYLNGEH